MTLKAAAPSDCNAASRTFTGSSSLRSTFSIACRSLSLSHTASGACAMAATRFLTGLRPLVATDKAARADLLTAVGVFVAPLGRFAALRFLAMVLSPRGPSGEFHVIVVESHACRGADRALKIQGVLHFRLGSGRADAGRRRQGAAGRRRRTLAAGDPVPRPHRVGQIVADRVSAAVVERGRRGRIEAAVLALPLRPQPVDIGVKQEEQRILGGRPNAGNGAAEAGMRRSVRIAFQRSERGVLSAKAQRLRLVAQARRRRGGAEKGPAVDPLHAVGLPELQRVGGAEADGAELIGGAEEIRREDVRRRPIEAPVWQRDAWIDRLQLAFEIAEISAVPGQKARRAVGLWRADIGVHVAEV